MSVSEERLTEESGPGALHRSQAHGAVFVATGGIEIGETIHSN